MQQVTRSTYIEYIRRLTDYWDIPIETRTRSVMQTVDGKGRLVAQAIYTPNLTEYQVREN